MEEINGTSCSIFVGSFSPVGEPGGVEFAVFLQIPTISTTVIIQP